jgi:RNA polymerase sigma factor (sigma-70 family)
LAAALSIGRASAVEAPPAARGAELTGALYKRYSSQIYGFCLHKLGSREEAEDAVQTTFLNAFRGLARGVEPQAESAWLFKIAENVCLSRHRSSFRRRRVESPSDLEALQDVLPGHQPEKDELHGLERVLERMPETQRRAILLREWQGLSYHEIADEMGITQAAVETLIFRARRALAQGLGNVEGEPLRRRARRSVDAGSLVAALKSFLGSVAAMKTAATVVAVTSASVVAVTPSPLRHHAARHQQRSVRTPAAARPATRAAASAPAVPAVAPRSVPVAVAAKPYPQRRAVTRHPAAPSVPARLAVVRAPAPRPTVAAPVAAAPPVETQAPAPQPQADASPTLAAPAASPPSAGTAEDKRSGAASGRYGNKDGRYAGRFDGQALAATPLPPTSGRKGDGHGKKDRPRGGNSSHPKKDRQPTGAVALPAPPAAPPATTPATTPAPADAAATDPAPPAGDTSGVQQQGAEGGVTQPAVSGGYETAGNGPSRTSRSDDR